MNWGIVLMVIGGLSFILPIFGRQFILVSLLGLTGMGSAVAGVVLFVAGIALFNAGRKKETEFVATELLGQQTQTRKEESKQELLPANINTASLAAPKVATDSLSITVTQSNSQEPSTMPNIEILAESQVKNENLVQVFKRAFFSTSTDSDGDLLVQSEGVRVFVKIDVEKKLLAFMTMIRIKESATESAKLSLVNKLNNELVLVRFAVPRSDLMIADCTLPFEEGIPAFQIVATLRLFSRVIISAIRGYDEHDLVL